MKKLIYISLILILASCVNSSDRYHSRAEKLIAEGRYAEANVLLDRAIERNPRNIFALMDRGVNKSLLGDYAGAIEDYSRVIEIDSNKTLPWVNRGRNRVRLGDYHGAIEDFNKAIETIGGERNSFFRFNLVDNIFFRVEACRFNVEMEEIRFERGFARYNIGELGKAYEDFRYAIRWGIDLPASFYMVGLIYLADGDIDLACEMFLKALMGRLSGVTETLNEHCEWMLSADNL